MLEIFGNIIKSDIFLFIIVFASCLSGGLNKVEGKGRKMISLFLDFILAIIQMILLICLLESVNINDKDLTVYVFASMLIINAVKDMAESIVPAIMNLFKPKND